MIHMKGYLISLRKNNYESIRKSEYSVVGFTKNCHIVENIKPDDKLIIYIASGISKIVGILNVEDKVYWDTEMLWDEVYPKRLRTSPSIILPNDEWIDVREIKNNLSFITNKDIPKFGVYFMHGIRRLNDADFDYLFSLIREADGNREKTSL